MNYDQIPAEEVILNAANSLKQNGFDVHIVENGAAAKAKALEILPEGAEVMTMTSTTNNTIGLYEEIENSGKYDYVRNKFEGMSAQEKRRVGAAPDWAVGSVHAITEEGSVVIASNTGSQLPAYAYGAENVIWVVGTQKIVPNFEAALKRIYDYTLGLESERAKIAYGVEGSFVSKLLVINKEVNPGRLHIILVKEVLGF